VPERIVVNLDQPASYWHWAWPDWVQISYPNLIVVISLLALFVLALVLPFPKGKDAE
jgi:hypothetical protein